VSSHVTLSLHQPEETVDCDFPAALVSYPPGSTINPITDYFVTTGNLIKKIVDTKYSNDAEILGLLVLGVVSCAEFYFKSVLSQLTRVCPICESHTEALNIPIGSIAFYAQSGFPYVMSAFEHESLADSKKISNEVKRFANLTCSDNSSVKKALDDFELLCELRHCFVHARGFAGLKAVRAMGGTRTLQKVLVKQQQALDFIKLSHNAVRAINRFLSEETLNRWIDKDVVVGEWATDKELFGRYLNLFGKSGEDAYSGSAPKAYAQVRPVILKRQQAIAAKVGAKP